MKKMIMLGMLVAVFFNLSGLAFEPVIVDNGSHAIVGDSTSLSNRHRLMSTEGRDGRTKFVDIRTYPYLGYVKNEMAYREVSERILTNINSGQFWSHVVLGDTIEPEYLMVPTEVSSGNTTVIFGVRVECEEGFYPSDLVFTLTSNDSDRDGSNRFGKVERYSVSNYIYAGTSMAQISSGPMITSGEWRAAKVSRFMFIGSLSKTANANTQADRDSIRRWMWSYPNFGITGTWSLVENGQTIASSSRELKLLTSPNLMIGIHRNQDGNPFILLKVTGSIGRDILVEFAPTVNGPWQREFVGTGGGQWTMPVTGERGRSGIFRAASLKPFGY
jgi:hypothetical protein